MTPPAATEVTACRVCNGTDLHVYLDLGEQPLANAFLRTDQLTKPELRVPLRVAHCRGCGLSQLTHVVNPDLLYRNYLYESGHSEGWRRHTDALADELVALAGTGALVYDIGCNDGTLLRAILARGLWPFGIDPAGNLDCDMVPVVQNYWSEATAKHCIAAGKQPDVIVAQNVFGHVADPLDFLRGVAVALKPGGTCIIECPHILPLLQQVAFDTIYHEHVSYWSLGPLLHVARQAGLAVDRVQAFPNLHGGTMRYYLRHAEDVRLIHGSTSRLMSQEVWELDNAAYSRFAEQVEATLHWLQQRLLARAANRVLAYGASAKSTVLFNALSARGIGVATVVDAVIDETPAKHGLFTPGTHLVIIPPLPSYEDEDDILITAPNWAASIMEKTRAKGFRGHYLLPWNGGEVVPA